MFAWEIELRNKVLNPRSKTAEVFNEYNQESKEFVRLQYLKALSKRFLKTQEEEIVGFMLCQIEFEKTQDRKPYTDIAYRKLIEHLLILLHEIQPENEKLKHEIHIYIKYHDSDFNKSLDSPWNKKLYDL